MPKTSEVEPIVQPSERWRAKVIGECRKYIDGVISRSLFDVRLEELFAEEPGPKHVLSEEGEDGNTDNT